MKINNKGYLLVEIVIAAVIAFAIAYFLFDLTVNLGNKEEDYYVNTLLETDKLIMTKDIMNDISSYNLVSVTTGNIDEGKKYYVDFELEDTSTNNKVNKRLSVDTVEYIYEYGKYNSDTNKFDDDDIDYIKKEFSDELNVSGIEVINYCLLNNEYKKCSEVIEEGKEKEITDGLVNIKVTAKTLYSDYNYGVELNIQYKYKEVKIILGDLIVNTNDINAYNNSASFTNNISCTNSSTSRWDYANNKLIISSLNASETCDVNFSNNKVKLTDFIINNVGSTQGDGKIVKETVATFSGGSPISKSSYKNLVNDATYPFSWDSGRSLWKSTNFDMNSVSNLSFNVSSSGNYQICYKITSGSLFSNSNYATFYKNDKELFNLREVPEGTLQCLYVGNINSSDKIKVKYDVGVFPTDNDELVEFYFQKANANFSYAGTRYEGVNPNNYVLFNNELWRVIGVFDSSTHGKSGNLTKIIRNDGIGSYLWSTSNSNNWNSSVMKNILNNYYYNASNGNSSGNCYLYKGSDATVSANCDFGNIGLNSKSRSMIESVTWKLGGHNSNNVSVYEYYNLERSNNVYSGNPTSTTGYVGLMYPSDYGYSVLESDCVRGISMELYSTYNFCSGSSWLLKYENEWTMTHYASNYTGVYYIYGFNNSGCGGMACGYQTRPVVYLKDSVYIVSGKGTQTDPYILNI